MNPASKILALFACILLASCASSKPNRKLVPLYDSNHSPVAVVHEGEIPMLTEGKNPLELPVLVTAPEAAKVNWRKAGLFVLRLGASLVQNFPVDEN